MTYQAPPALPKPPRTAPQVPGPATGPANIPANADLGALQTQLGELTIQRAGLKAQWDGLRRQLDNMLQTNPARPGVAQEWADVGSQIAKVDGQIAELRARISLKQGALPGAVVAPPPSGNRRPDPDMIVGGTFAVLMALVLPISISYAVRNLRRGRPGPSAPAQDYSGRFDRLEQAVDAIAIEVERVSEGQRFVTKILAERPAESKALGAGAAEPVRFGERQAEKQPISTPRRDL
jgi:hypothetical protein